MICVVSWLLAKIICFLAASYMQVHCDISHTQKEVLLLIRMHDDQVAKNSCAHPSMSQNSRTTSKKKKQNQQILTTPHQLIFVIIKKSIFYFSVLFHFSLCMFCMYNMAPLKLNSVILVFVGTAHFEPLGHLKSLALGGADDKGLLW